MSHLQRSNAELAEALAESGPDREFEKAIKENTRIVADLQEKIYLLTVEIAGIRGNVELVTPRGAATEADGQWL